MLIYLRNKQNKTKYMNKLIENFFLYIVLHNKTKPVMRPHASSNVSTSHDSARSIGVQQ